MIDLRVISGLQLIKKVMSFFQTSKNSDTQHRLQDVFADGLIRDSQVSETREFEMIPVSGLSVRIGTGKAYKNGERIIINDINESYGTSVQEILEDQSLSSSTTGCSGITLTDDTVNKLWIRYQKILDSTDYVLHPVTSEQLFYKTSDSYQITISPNNPDVTKWLLLVEVTVASGAIDVINYSDRIFLGISSEIITIDATYGTTLQDHIEAQGSNPIAADNPHGISFKDMPDWEPYDVSVMQRYTHTTGIIDTDDDALNIDATATGATYFYNGYFYQDGLEIHKLGTDEKVLLNGYLIDDIIPKCSETLYVTNPWTDLENSFVPFAEVLDASGTWHVLLETETVDDIVKGKVRKTQEAVPSNALLLYDVEWNGLDIVGSTDYRIFGVTSAKDLQRFKIHNGRIYIDGDVEISGNVYAANLP